jgi:hypothetical protein
MGNPYRRIVSCLLLAAILLGSGCTVPPPPLPETPPGPAPTSAAQPTPYPESMVTFRVKLPESLPAGDSLYLTILDEVTGLALNPQKVVMQAEDARSFLVILPFQLKSVIKYRYQRQNAQEHLSDGRPVRYRMLYVDGPGMVSDVVSRWTDTTFSGETGRIQGQVVDAQRGTPLPGILVAAAGAQTFTAADGSYKLEGVPEGTHNLVAYALDGEYQVYQQGARVAAGSATPAPLFLTAAPMVRVTFTVSVPDSTLAGAPVRLAGSLYSLGNAFADLAGGASTVASRLPVLSRMPDGRHSITLELPAGSDLRYKYTLGDGLWNAEHSMDGAFTVRQLIVPDQPAALEERVATWSRGNSAPITFDVSVPANTPGEEFVSIQFNPGHAWTEALPMWPAGSGRWVYVLYSPMDPLGQVRYRYCRNEQCSSADDSRTSGFQAVGHSVSSSLLPSTLDDRVDRWHWLEDLSSPITLPNVEIRPRGSDFITGVELLPYFHPSWTARLPSAVVDIKSMNSSWLVLTPTWSYTRAYPPVLELQPGIDPLWGDLQAATGEAHRQELRLAVFPTPNFPTPAMRWWAEAPRDFSFWVAWYESYRAFLLHHAGLAEAAGAEALIVGGDWLLPSLPGGMLADGESATTPEDAEDRWRSILEDVRTRFSGRLLWASGYPLAEEEHLPFLDLVDGLYLIWSAPLQEYTGESEVEMARTAGALLDEGIGPVVEETGMMVVLGLSYPSAEGWLAGCARSGSRCVELDTLSRPNTDFPDIGVSLEDQVRAYNAVLLAVNERDWISGVVSRGYYPPAVLHDKSTSVHGKPARGVLWYWFPRLVGE